MQKQKLENFIEKYALGGEVESVTLNSDGSNLSVYFMSSDKTLLGEVEMSDIDFPRGDYNIFTTSQFKSMLGVLDADIKVESDSSGMENYIQMADKNTSMNYMIAEDIAMPNLPSKDSVKIPDFDVEITLDSNFINRFVKSKAALSDSENFTFVYEEGQGKIVIGYAKKQNTNRVSINVDSKTSESKIEPISFSADFFKEVLSANKGADESTLKISTKGLARAEFKTGTLKSTYNMVAK